MRLALAGLAVLWLIAEWALALPPLLREGFWRWHLAALDRLRHDAAFQLVTLDYLLAYAVAFGLSVRDARRRSARWGLWAAAFLMFTAPALLLYWTTRSEALEDEGKAQPSD